MSKRQDATYAVFVKKLYSLHQRSWYLIRNILSLPKGTVKKHGFKNHEEMVRDEVAKTNAKDKLLWEGIQRRLPSYFKKS